MNSTKIKILFALIITFLTISSFFIWENIYIPISDLTIKNYTGTIYVENKFNYWNEIIRFFYAIFLPIFFYFIYLVITKNCFFTFKRKVKLDDNFIKKGNLNLFYFVSFFFILNFLFLKPSIHVIDSLHEGMRLTAWENFKYYENFWKSSFITVGWGQEFLIPLLSNFLFEEVSINRTRLILFFYKFLNQFLLLILIYQITSNQNFQKRIKDLLFLLFATIILIISNFYDPILSHREIPIIIFFIFLLNILNNNNIVTYLFLTGLLSSLSLIWSLDRGMFLNVLLILFLTFQIINGNYKFFFILFISIVFGWIVIFLLFGSDEFLNFFKNSIWVFSNIENIYGLIHPTPFGDQAGSSRAGKNIIILLLTSIFSVYFGLSKNIKFTNSNKIFLLFLLSVSLLSYKTALGRSDGPHLRAAMFFSYITLSFIILVNFGHYLEKKYYEKNLPKFFKYVSTFFFIFFVSKLIILDSRIVENNFKITLFNERSDEFYIKKREAKLYNLIKKEFKDEVCINNFTYEASLPYLISKPTCDKYYFIYSLGGEKIQHEYINFLKNSKSQMVILKKDDKYINNSVKKILPIIFKYINDNYDTHLEIDGFIILKKNT